MKWQHILLVGGMLLAIADPISARIHLEEGDTYTFEFNGLPHVGFDPAKVGKQELFVDLTFGPDIIEYPERLHAEYYEDVLGGDWWMKSSIGVLPGNTRMFSGNGAGGELGDMFADLQGVIHFWMETGSVDVRSVDFSLCRDGQIYQQHFVLPVPEPNSAVLTTVCIGFLIYAVPRGFGRQVSRPEAGRSLA